MRTLSLVRLGDVCSPKQWKTLSKKEMVSDGFPVYGANGKIGFASKFTHTKPTLLIGCRGSCGSVHIMEPFSYANGNAMALDNLNEDLVDIKYIYHYFLHRGFADVITGSSQPQIIQQHLRKIEMPLPPLEEQRRIAVILDQVKRIGRLAAHRNQLTTEMKASAFSQRFGNTHTNNKGWEAATISELVDLENGDRSSNYPSKGDIKTEGILFLGTKNIVDDELSLEKCQYISKEKFNSLSRGKLSRGDIVITLRGTLGRVAIFDCQHETGFINAQTLILRPRKIDPVFLHALFRDRTFRNALLRSSTGAAVPQLTSKQISNLVIPIPPIDQQIKFKNECNAIDSLKRNSLKSVDRNEKLSKSLTSQLIGF